MDVPHRSESEQRRFFEEAHERFERAGDACGRIERTLLLAGTRIRLIFAGERLLGELFPALAHLVIEDSAAPDVSFEIWDSDSTGVPMIAPPCERAHFTDRGDIWGFRSQRFRIAFHWIECSVNLIDLERRTAIYWVQSAQQLPYWAKASPLRTLFHWWMESQGAQLLHAAAVGNDGGAVLITGRGGVGKSTTALTCLAHGLRYVGDDYLVVTLEPRPAAHSLYGTAKLDADQLARFPALAPLVCNAGCADADKAVLAVHPARAGQIARALPLQAVLTPRIVPQRESGIAPTSRLQLVRAAAFTTMSQLPYAGRTTQRFVEQLVSRLPGFELRLGSDLERIPQVIEDLLRAPQPALAAPGGDASSQTLTARPLVSVIIPVHDGARFLREAVESVLAQRYPALEIIVVDDGSSDDIDAAVASLPVDVRYFKQPNGGAASARNRGIKDASGELIAFLDVDDLWPADNLDSLVDLLLERPALRVIQGYAQLMEFDPVSGRYEYVGNPGESFPHYIGAALYRRAAFEEVGLFETELRFAEDTDWFQRASERELCIERIPQVTLLVRRHGTNMTRGKTLVELNTLRVFKRALDRRRGRP